MKKKKKKGGLARHNTGHGIWFKAQQQNVGLHTKHVPQNVG